MKEYLDVLVPAAYVLVFIGLCVLMSRALNQNRTADWALLYGAEALSAAAATGAMFWFDSLVGYGMMPGLTWFAVTFYSMTAAGLFLVMIPISAGLHFWSSKRKNKR